MKKLVIFIVVSALIGIACGLTSMQESFHNVGTTNFYESETAPGAGTEVLSLQNQGTTDVLKVVVADRTDKGPRMSITEVISLVPGQPPSPPQPPCPPKASPKDPTEFVGIAWGPNAKVEVNGVSTFEGIETHVAFGEKGTGSKNVRIDGDSAIISIWNKQFAPDNKDFLPICKPQPPAWPPPPPPPDP